MLQQENQKQLIIFDWDGTLFDSVNNIIQCKIDVANYFNIEAPSAIVVKRCLGMEFNTALSLCFPKSNKHFLKKIGQEFLSRIHEEKYHSFLFPTAIEVIQYLKNKGHTLAVATSKSRAELDKSIFDNNVSNFFDQTLCAEESKGKPEPDMIDTIIARTHFNKEKVVMVGDTTTDLIFSKKAGIKFIGVTFGAHSKEMLISEQPDFLINSLDKLKDIF